ncbi:Hsp20/alpha crystallin family protein [Paremcibacter congregatus]|uniref:Molecular chaperone Hsp20 n=1 Tax=Paremcibacter congregatus TaxID=2043170 RepID=A0A2G4YTW5_9PROT|nr:Hsp20/alpha crystallin family protein [Paremcibacter congregatus]PHZ85781.1 molecular chaperone Hsp20 [Paremcibacter congregatus]QDE26742.1 Hsp20/alpha crystallin family protein [Paremcibacter congregatus]|tara:strand:- start:6792 stop:7295 length:504 start_codon:yes stop_codon:yes gene_type:complete
MSIRDLVPSLWQEKGNGRRESLMPIETLKEEMDQLFDNFYPLSGRPFQRRWADRKISSIALADIGETEKAFEVTMDLPGFDEKDIDITYADNQLTVEGKKEDTREEDGREYHRLERSCGSFRRSFYLPVDVLEDKMNAVFKKGVLKITLPKSPEAQKAQKKIAIKTA